MYRISLPRQVSVCTANGTEEICGQKFRSSMLPPRTVRTAPVTRPTVRLFTRLANLAENRLAAVATVIHRSITFHFSSRMAGWIRI